MPWWAYGPVGMQLWFPSIVLSTMQLQTLHSGGSNSTLHSQASLPAQLTPHAATAGAGPGAFPGGLGSRTSSGVPSVLGRSGSLWPPAGPVVPGSGVSMAAMAAAGAAATAAAAASQPGSATSAAMRMKHAQSAPALAQEGAAGAGGFQAIQYGTEIELEFDREVYPIAVSLADASIVGITQRVMRPQQAAAGQVRGVGASWTVYPIVMYLTCDFANVQDLCNGAVPRLSRAFAPTASLPGRDCGWADLHKRHTGELSFSASPSTVLCIRIRNRPGWCTLNTVGR